MLISLGGGGALQPAFYGTPRQDFEFWCVREEPNVGIPLTRYFWRAFTCVKKLRDVWTTCVNMYTSRSYIVSTFFYARKRTWNITRQWKSTFVGRWRVQRTSLLNVAPTCSTTSLLAVSFLGDYGNQQCVRRQFRWKFCCRGNGVRTHSVNTECKVSSVI